VRATIENPLCRVPVSMILDDACPVVNLSHFWIRLREVAKPLALEPGTWAKDGGGRWWWRGVWRRARLRFTRCEARALGRGAEDTRD